MVVYSVNDYLKWNRGTNDNVEKIMKERAKHRYYCKCGHSVTIKPSEIKVLCHWCNNWVFKNKQDEFKYRLKEKMK